MRWLISRQISCGSGVYSLPIGQSSQRQQVDSLAGRPDVAIVVDSACCLPPDLLRRWNITQVPHELVIEGRSYRDGVDINPDDFYKILRQGQIVPTTAAPQPQAFLDGLLDASEFASNILCITVASNFSVANRSAQAAVEMAGDRLSHCRVKVVDSQAAAGALGLIALAAARWAHEGCDLDQVSGRIDQLIPRVNMMAFLESFDYLNRSGRVSKIKAWTGSLLGIRPLTELQGGQARLLERPRSRRRAMDRVVAIMKQRVGMAPAVVNIMEADAAEDALAMERRIREVVDCRELFISQFTPVMGAHTGPGLLGVAFYTDEDQPNQPSSMETHQGI
jgi:DegV family protein with EDD domain